MSCSTFVVPQHHRDAGALPTEPHPAGAGRRGRRETDGVRREPAHIAAESATCEIALIGCAMFNLLPKPKSVAILFTFLFPF